MKVHVPITDKKEILKALEGEVIISCQALPEEPLHSSFIMGRMAYAAMLAGAKGIRANSVVDIREIKNTVDLPIIGIIKKVYGDNPVFITPTMAEIDALVEEGVEIIALDATRRIRPDGKTIEEVFPLIRKKYPNQMFMADCSSYEDASLASELGFDCLGSTLAGYTEDTKGAVLPDFTMVEKMVVNLDKPVIAEGGISTPEELKRIMDLKVHAAVVGSAITRPLEIAKRFISAVK
ncbi:MAG: N-acetylmannosamine-6-phosphate 2-epimerase [Clostridium sp.]|nr:N-acetylmannosamine-6-phosphate 2-epimerase [Clostridium sp.]